MIGDIKQEIKQMLSSMTGLDPEKIKDTDDLIKDLEIDSLKVIEIAAQIEKKYKVTVKDSQLRKIRTVNDAVNLIKNLAGKKKA